MADATFRSGGLASGIDTNTIIDKLIELESRPVNIVRQRQSGIKTQISKIAEIKSKLSDLISAAKTLGTSGMVATSVSSTHTSFEAVTGTGATAGRHTVNVTALASASTARSQAFTAASAPVTGGTLAMTVQNKSYNINIADGASLSDVAFSIRQSGAPVSATVINDGTASYLSIINNQTGFPLASGPNSALNMIETSTGVLGQRLTHPVDGLMKQIAVNAEVSVDGLPITRQSNSISDVIPGVTLNLKALTGVTDETVVIGNSVEGSKTNLSKFVDSYNSIVRLVQAQLAAPAGSDRSTSLSGDTSIRGLQQTLQSLITKKVSETGIVRTLADVGVKTGRDGSLTIDSATLTKALERDANAVNELFSAATTGLSAVVTTAAERYSNAATGLLALRTKGLESSVRKMDDQIANLELRIEGKRTQLINQFTAMEKVVSSMRSTGNFLTNFNAIPSGG